MEEYLGDCSWFSSSASRECGSGECEVWISPSSSNPLHVCLHHHHHQTQFVSTVGAWLEWMTQRSAQCCWELFGGMTVSLHLALGLHNVRSRPINKLREQIEASRSFSNHANLENDNILWHLDIWIKMLLAWGHQSRNFGNSRSHMAASRPRKALSRHTCGPLMASHCTTIHQLRSANLNYLYWWTTCVLTDKILGL